MAPTANAGIAGSNPFLDMIEALSNRHGQVDIRLDHLSLRLPFVERTVELNGTISVSVHLRELTEKERSAHVAKQVRSLAT
jgi:hypothetical protein